MSHFEFNIIIKGQNSSEQSIKLLLLTSISRNLIFQACISVLIVNKFPNQKFLKVT